MANEFLQGVKQAHDEQISDQINARAWNQDIRLDDQNRRAWDTNKRLNAQEDRVAAQQALSNKIAGYNRVNGEWIPSEARKNQDSYNSQLINLQLQQLNEASALLVAQNNTRDMTNSIKALSMGRVKDAVTILNQNPILERQLLKQFGAASLEPIDWVNDQKLFEGSDIKIDPEHLKDPKVVNALNSSFFKIIGPDGKAKLGNVQNLVRQTNTLNYMTEEDQKGLTRRFNLIGDILKGSVIKDPMSVKEQMVREGVNDVALDVTELKTKVTKQIIEDPNLSAEEKLSKIASANTTTDQKKLLEILKLGEEYKTAKEKNNPNGLTVQNKLLDFKKKEMDLEKLRMELNEAKDPNSTENKKKKAELKEKEAKANKAEAELLKEVPLPANSIEVVKDLLKVPTKDLTYDQELVLRKIEDSNGGVKAIKKPLETAKVKYMFGNLFEELLPKVDKLDYDLIEKGKNQIKKMFNADKLTDDERRKAFAYLGFDTEMGIRMASYIKEMSGAAVTDSERALYGALLKGGTTAGKSAVKTAIESFVNSVRSEARQYGSSIMLSHPMSFRYLNELDKSIGSGNTGGSGGYSGNKIVNLSGAKQ